MPNCFKCGALHGTGDEFCPECGERLIVKVSIFLILIAIMVIIGIVVFFTLKTPKTSSTSSTGLPTAMSTAISTGEEKNDNYHEMELQKQIEEDYDNLMMEEELQQEFLYEENLGDSQLITSPSTPVPKCTDSDSGKDYYTKGYITHSDGDREYDKCDMINIGSEDFVIEYFCTSTGSGQIDYECLYGCENGKCIDKPKCEYGYLDDYKCDGDVLRRKRVNSDCSFDWSYYETCDYGCKDGKCNDRPCGEWGYADEYKCDGKVIRRKWINHDCSFEWFYYLTCYYGCENGKCIDKPKCEYGYLDDYKCDGDVLRRKRVNSDCSFDWSYYETCDYGCKDGKCNDRPCGEWGYADEYKCDGKVIRRKWINHDCSFEWFYYLTCYHGCENGKCIDKPPQEEQDYIQDQCIYITNFHFNAVGDDNYNLNDEYVTFKNKCSYSIDMTGWTVRDETAYHVYTFPSFTFGSGTTFTLYTGTGTSTNSALYWGRTPGAYAAVWNNQGGDTLFLRDSNGNLVLSQNYVGY